MNRILKIGIKINRFFMVVSGILFFFFILDISLELQILALLSAIVLGGYQVLFTFVLSLSNSDLKPAKSVFIFYFSSIILYFIFYLAALKNYFRFYNDCVFSGVAIFLALYLTWFLEKSYQNNQN
ncbi:membrane protein of unknown function [Tenacibaculum jejuense]|uniref:Uncharacterized protein n=1 Tax=Tenacibaculum jejuense TaxID=584609 RepID=A0A238UCM9_9FLAO|nr:membrane protein of unknown function [Tenacibaculum jejuense]